MAVATWQWKMYSISLKVRLLPARFAPSACYIWNAHLPSLQLHLASEDGCYCQRGPATAVQPKAVFEHFLQLIGHAASAAFQHFQGAHVTESIFPRTPSAITYNQMCTICLRTTIKALTPLHSIGRALVNHRPTLGHKLVNKHNIKAPNSGQILSLPCRRVQCRQPTQPTAHHDNYDGSTISNPGAQGPGSVRRSCTHLRSRGSP